MLGKVQTYFACTAIVSAPKPVVESLMLQDAHDLTEGQLLEADICIAGAGAAGIAIALELLDSGLDVILLESGGLKEERASQALYTGTVANAQLHSPPDRYRQRRLGGSTTLWGGRCVPFDDIDFEERPYLPGSGWPFTRQSLEPYYQRANTLCEAGNFAYTVTEAFPSPLPPVLPGFTSTDYSTHCLERFSCPTNFGQRYRNRLVTASNLRVVLHANVVQVSLNQAGTRVTEVGLRTLEGKTCRVHARHHVLALGGLEVARVLLANRDTHHNGIGNDRDLVGRNYMCHVAGTIGTLELHDQRAAISHGYDLVEGGVYCRRRFALNAATQRRLGIGNFIARLHHPRITDPRHDTGILSLLYLAKPFIPYEYAKRLHGEEAASWRQWLAHVGNVCADPADTAAFLWNWYRRRHLASRKLPSIVVWPKTRRFSLDFHSEQQPQSASRVRLDEQRDALGMPQLHVDWRYSPWDIHTVRCSLALFARDIRNSGIGTFTYDAAELEAEILRDGAYGGHHIGTARMGDDPRTSVVNADGRIHGVGNLSIAGSAIFPTSSQANPTLTVVALAVRLAEHLKQQLQANCPVVRNVPA
jgi:choline dehydrogenase-like flavoprotein